MTLYDFFQEKILPWFKDDYQEFSSKTVDGYSLYVATWDKTPRQAMITKNAPALLQRIFDKFSASTGNKEAGLQSSQVSRWYVNGFTSAYNYCRRYDLDHPFEHTDFAQWSIKLNSSDDLERDEWDIDMFRKYTINFGRREGTLFYVAEREASNGKIEDKQGELSTGDNNTLPSDVNNEKKLYDFSKGLINELYDRFNGEIFEDLSSVEEFENILTRKDRTKTLKICYRKKTQMQKLLYNFYHMLLEDFCDSWLVDIVEVCGCTVDDVKKKHNAGDSYSVKYRETLDLIDKIFNKYSRP